MSTYEELQIIISTALLIVAILTYTHNHQKCLRHILMIVCSRQGLEQARTLARCQTRNSRPALR